jgi:hypothetical protein
MKKRLLTFSLAALFCLPLISCGDKSKTNASDGRPITEAPEAAGQESTDQAAETEKAEPQMTSEMMTAFQRFRSAMLRKDRHVLVAMSLPGLENGCAYEDKDRDSTAYKLCDMLDDNQLAVLKKRTHASSKTDVTADGCAYEDSFTPDEDGNGFFWSAGCIHLLEEEIGEYGTSFHFRKVNGKYRIDRVYCAG